MAWANCYMHVIYGENCRKKAIENAMQKKTTTKNTV